MRFPDRTSTGMKVPFLLLAIWQQIIEGHYEIGPYGLCQVCFGPSEKIAVIRNRSTGNLYDEQYCSECWSWAVNIFQESTHAEFTHDNKQEGPPEPDRKLLN